MNTTTSLDRDQILNLCELIHTSRSGNLPPAGSRVLGLFRCIQVTLLTLRHNLTQGLGKVFHSSCWLGDLSGLGDELEWSQRVSRVVSEGCGDADSSGQAMEADRGVA